MTGRGLHGEVDLDILFGHFCPEGGADSAEVSHDVKAMTSGHCIVHESTEAVHDRGSTAEGSVVDDTVPTTSLCAYSFQSDMVVSGRSNMQLLGWPQALLPRDTMSDA